MFQAILKRFQRVSAGGSAPEEKTTRLPGSESNHRTAKAKIFPRNGRCRFKSRSAQVWITRFPVRRSLAYKSLRNGEKIPRLPAQIWLSRCCIMRTANGCDTRFEDRSLATAPLDKNHTRQGWEGTIAYYANQHRARVRCVTFHRKPLNAWWIIWNPAKSRECIRSL